MALTARVPALLAVLGLLVASPCQAAKETDLAKVWASRYGGHSVRGSVAQVPPAPFWLKYLPEAMTFYLRWVPQLQAMDDRIRANVNASESDPLWQEAKDLVRNAANHTVQAARIMALCKKGPMDEYAVEACANDRFGATMLNGIPAGAYFCGSMNSGINWTRSWAVGDNKLPLAEICSAKPGTAYSETGFCGRWSLKWQVLGTFLALPRALEDPVLLNVPSLHCLLDLGECDIAYCQNCPGRCGHV